MVLLLVHTHVAHGQLTLVAKLAERLESDGVHLTREVLVAEADDGGQLHQLDHERVGAVQVVLADHDERRALA